MPLPPGTRLGRYEVIAPLGAGGMGEVFRARDTKLGRDVALKVLPDRFASDRRMLARFESEAKAVAALSHPNILALFDVGEENGVPFAVAELLEGETLRALLLRGPVPVRRALEIAREVAEGLAAAHEKAVVHRDIKPENAFLTRDGHAKVLDFGLARYETSFRSDDESRSPTVSVLTEAGAVVGTVAYMSPEQARGLPVDHRSDQFSLGAVLYEMLTGKRAFRADTPADVLTAIIRDEPEPLETLAPSVPVPVRWIVDRCLAKEPDGRYESTRDLARDVARCHQHLTRALPATADLRPDGASRRTRWIGAVVLAGIVGLGGAVAGFIAAPRSSERPLPSFQRLTFRRGFVSGARFAPGGKTVVYSAAWDGRPQQVWTVLVDTLETLDTDLPPARLLAVSPSGEVAISPGSRMSRFGNSGTLPRLAIGSLRGTTPRIVAPGISSADWSRDGAVLAVGRETLPGATLEQPPGTVLARSTTYISDVRTSPTGDRIAYVEHDHDGNSGGVVAVADRAGRKTVLTPWYFDVNGLAWSPAGDEVWFTAAPRGTPKSIRAVTLSGKEREIHRETGHLVLMDVARDGRALLAREDFRQRIFFRSGEAGPDRELSLLDCSRLWDMTRDGRTLSFWEYGEGAGRGERRVFLRSTSGGPPIHLEGGRGQRPVFSPDGAFFVMGIPGSEAVEVAIYPIGEGEPRKVPMNGFSDATAGLLPDGAGIWLADMSPGRPQRVFVAGSEGTNRHPVTPEGVVGRVPWISWDGRAVVGLSGGVFRLYPVAGGEAVPLEGVKNGEALAGWADGGRSVFAYDPALLPATIARVEWTSGARTEVGSIAPPDLAGALGISILVTPDGRQAAYMVSEDLRVLYVVAGLR